MKIVINTAPYGSFNLSKTFYEHYNIPYVTFNIQNEPKIHWTNNERKDSRLISFIEQFGSEVASGEYAHLKIVDIPKGTKYYIDNYKGEEFIVTEDDIEWEIAINDEIQFYIDIILNDNENGYTIIADFIHRYWSIVNTDSPVIISLELSCNGIEYKTYKGIAFLINAYGGIEFCPNWWEGQKYIKLLGIKSIDDVEILGGIYTE